MEYASFWLALVSTLGLFLLSIERWARSREKKETTIDHQAQIAELSLKHQDALMEATRQLQHQRLEERITGLERRIEEMRQKSSDHNSLQQIRIGEMELKCVEFIAKADAQLKELFRILGKRRNAGERGEHS